MGLHIGGGCRRPGLGTGGRHAAHDCSAWLPSQPSPPSPMPAPHACPPVPGASSLYTLLGLLQLVAGLLFIIAPYKVGRGVGAGHGGRHEAGPLCLGHGLHCGEQRLPVARRLGSAPFLLMRHLHHSPSPSPALLGPDDRPLLPQHAPATPLRGHWWVGWGGAWELGGGVGARRHQDGQACE